MQFRILVCDNESAASRGEAESTYKELKCTGTVLEAFKKAVVYVLGYDSIREAFRDKNSIAVSYWGSENNMNIESISDYLEDFDPSGDAFIVNIKDINGNVYYENEYATRLYQKHLAALSDSEDADDFEDEDDTENITYFGLTNEDAYSPAPSNVSFGYYRNPRRDDPKSYDKIAFQVTYEMYSLIHTAPNSLFAEITSLILKYMRNPTDIRDGINLEAFLNQLIVISSRTGNVFYKLHSQDKNCFVFSKQKGNRKLFYVAVNFDSYFNLVFDEVGNWLPEENPLNFKDLN